MTRPIRVCLVSPLPPPNGGIARWTRMIAERAAQHTGVQLSVINTALRWRSIHETSPLKRVFAGIPQLLSSGWALSRKMAGARPDVVHVNTSGQIGAVRDVFLLLISKVFGVPFIYHLRFGTVPQIAARNGAEWKLLACVIRGASTVIVLDQHTERAVTEHVRTARVTRIPNCVDFSRLPATDLPAADPPATGSDLAGRRTALFAGWVVAAKGIEELLAAWSQVGREDWALVLAGPYDEAYRDSLAQVAGSSPVEFLGELPHPAMLKLMAECDLFVLPSHTEGFPNAVLEAMALGKPIVSTDVGAIGEMLSGDCGVLVQPRNIEQLVSALSELIQDSDLRRRLGKQAQAKALSEYSLDGTFDRYRALWLQSVRRT